MTLSIPLTQRESTVQAGFEGELSPGRAREHSPEDPLRCAVLKLVIVVLYLGVLVGIGVLASRRQSDVKDYFAAGKSLGFLSVAFSSRATGESAWLLLGLTGMGAALGVKAFWVVFGEVLGVTLAWALMSRPFKRLTDRYDAITVADYLEGRFADKTQRVRIVAAFALSVFVTIYVSAQIDATGKAFETFLGWDYFVGAIVGFAVVMAYVVSGGFLAVVWSDVFQGMLMCAGLVLLPAAAFLLLPDGPGLTATLAAIDPKLVSWNGGDDSIVGLFGILSLALIGLGFLGSPQIFVRFLALRDEKEITRGMGVAITWTVLADSGAVLTGLLGRALLTTPEQSVTDVLGTGAENVLPLLVEHTFPAVLVGIYVAVVLAAIMSTVDSLLVVAASAVTRDWYQKVRHPELSDAELVPLSRKITFGLALAALAISLAVAVFVPGRTIFWFVIFGWSGIAATFCPTIILSLFWRGMTAKGAIAGMLGGFFAIPFFKFVAPSLPTIGPALSALEELAPSFLFSALAAVVVSLATSSEAPRDELDHAKS